MEKKNPLKPILINKFNQNINDTLLIFSQYNENKINNFLNNRKFNYLP